MRQDVKKIIRIASIAVLFLFIIIYAFFRSKDLIFGVKIRSVAINSTPIVDGSTFTDPIIVITGNAKNAVELTLDGRIISLDQAGNFNETISLLSGYNVLDIYAHDKFGHSDEKIYKLMH